jgi:hypothetical protein
MHVMHYKHACPLVRLGFCRFWYNRYPHNSFAALLQTTANAFAPSKRGPMTAADLRSNIDSVRQLTSRVSQFTSAGVLDSAGVTDTVAPLRAIVKSLTTTAVDETAPEAAHIATEALSDVTRAVCSIVNKTNTPGVCETAIIALCFGAPVIRFSSPFRRLFYCLLFRVNII